MSENDFYGDWEIFESDMWAKEDLDSNGKATITFDDDELGSLKFINYDTELCYRFDESENLMEFTFEGDDGNYRNRICGRGKAWIEDTQLKGHIFIHNGDDSDFSAKRIKSEME